MSAYPHQASGQPITCLLAEPETVAYGSYSFTTFINGSLALTIQLSLAPHPSAILRLTPDPSRDMAYPVRWLHCQSAQHPTVASDAPLLDYRGLNPWFCQSWCIESIHCELRKQLLMQLTLRKAQWEELPPIHHLFANFLTLNVVSRLATLRLATCRTLGKLR